MNISGKMRVFSKIFGERVAYSTGISNKKQDGTYETMYVNVQLPQGVGFDNGTEIEVTKGFISNFKNKEGNFQIKLIVQEFKENGSNFNVVTTDDDDSLPF